MKIGLFFGSFNPVHKGHLEIASYFLDHTDLHEVWFVVSPQNPLKEDADLLDVEKRLEMVYAATGETGAIKCSEIELGLPIPSFTIDTLGELSKMYSDEEFVILMGTDNLESLHLWKDYERILDQYQIYVYPRTGSAAVHFKNHPSITLIESKLLEISATMLRDQISRKEFDLWLPETVAEIIRERGYYSSTNY